MRPTVSRFLLLVALALSITSDAATQTAFSPPPENGPDATATTTAPTGPNGIITLLAGNGYIGYTGNGGPATKAQLALPQGVAVDSAGNTYIADQYAAVVRKVTAATGIISAYAGTGFGGYSGDGGPALKAQLDEPLGLALDAAGNLFIADSRNNVIREVNAKTGIITTVAGDGEGAGAGGADPCPSPGADGVSALNFPLCEPNSVALDSLGNLYISDYYRQAIRKVNTKTGIITTAAGSTFGYSGDGGLAIHAKISSPYQVAVDKANNLYIADWGNCAIRVVTAATGIIRSLVGTPVAGGYGGVCGFTPDGGPAAKAQIGFPGGVAVDANGNVYVADQEFQVIRLITSVPAGAAGEPELEEDASHPAAASSLNIYTIAGTFVRSAYGVFGIPGFGGYGGPATLADLDNPGQLAVDMNGNLFGADPDDAMVYRINGPSTLPTTAPAISPASQGFSGKLTVTIASRLAGSTTYFTLDGTLPNSSSAKYTGPIVLNNKSAIVTAFSDPPGTNSVASEGAYLCAPPAPTFNPPSGSTITTNTNIFLADSDRDLGFVTIYYTTNGSDPTLLSSNATKYERAFALKGPTTVVRAAAQLVAHDAGGHVSRMWSFISSATYYVKPAAVAKTDAGAGTHETLRH